MKYFLAVSAACLIVLAPRMSSACPTTIVPGLLLASEVADATTTFAGISQGTHEVNPLIRPFSHSGPLIVGVMFTMDFSRHRIAAMQGVSCGQQTTSDIIMTVLHGIMAAHNAAVLHH